jgi:hypothetical protein
MTMVAGPDGPRFVKRMSSRPCSAGNSGAAIHQPSAGGHGTPEPSAGRWASTMSRNASRNAPPWPCEPLGLRRSQSSAECFVKAAPMRHFEDIERTAGSTGLRNGRLQRVPYASKLGEQSAPFPNGSCLQRAPHANKLGEQSAPCVGVGADVFRLPDHRLQYVE